MPQKKNDAQEEKNLLAASILSLVLIAASFFVLFGRPYIVEAVRNKALSSTWLLLPSVVFAIVFLVFLIDEFQKTVSNHKRNFRKTMALALAFVVFAWMLPGALREFNTRKQLSFNNPTFLTDRARSKDARTRALLMLALANPRIRTKELPTLLDKGLHDPDPMVREAAQMTLGDLLKIELPDGSLNEDRVNILIEQLKSKFF